MAADTVHHHVTAHQTEYDHAHELDGNGPDHDHDARTSYDPDALLEADTDTKRATPPVLAIAANVWTCTCGNVAESDGFYPSDKTGAEQDPTIGGPWDSRTYTCARCSAVYVLCSDMLTGTVTGTYGVFVPWECVCTYALAGHTLNCLNYNGRRADKAAGR